MSTLEVINPKTTTVKELTIKLKNYKKQGIDAVLSGGNEIRIIKPKDARA